ncbi:MAG: hypothetical protein SOW59_07405 [Corynebacterium sp.]|nr:hypothetical protein [Corynebacterium sp.]
MTNHNESGANGAENIALDNALDIVTLARVMEAMKTFDVELTTVPGEQQLATANLNGFGVLFAVLNSAVIVRADVITSVTFTHADASLFLAAGSVNNTLLGARVVITERNNELVVRTEREFNCAAAMNDQQLHSALKKAVDGVIAAQDAMFEAAQKVSALASEEEN